MRSPVRAAQVQPVLLQRLRPKAPITITSNNFLMTDVQGVWLEDAHGLQANIIDVPVPVGGKCWIKEGQEEIDLA